MGRARGGGKEEVAAWQGGHPNWVLQRGKTILVGSQIQVFGMCGKRKIQGSALGDEEKAAT